MGCSRVPRSRDRSVVSSLRCLSSPALMAGGVGVVCTCYHGSFLTFDAAP